jgi:hypothetical protein
VAEINRNRRPTSPGTGGRNRPEQVADFAGIRTLTVPKVFQTYTMAELWEDEVNFNPAFSMACRIDRADFGSVVVCSFKAHNTCSLFDNLPTDFMPYSLIIWSLDKWRTFPDRSFLDGDRRSGFLYFIGLSASLMSEDDSGSFRFFSIVFSLLLKGY